MGYYRRRKSDDRWKKVAWSSLFVTWGVLGSLVLKSENPHHPMADADSEKAEEDVATDAEGNFTYLEVSASRPQPDGVAASQPAVSAASAQVEAQASAARQNQLSRPLEPARTAQQSSQASPKTNQKTAQLQPAQPSEPSANPGKVSARPQSSNPLVASAPSDRPMLVRPEGADASMGAASQASLPLLPPPTLSAVEQSAASAAAAGRLEAGAIADPPLPEADPQELAVLSSYATCSDQASFKPASASAEDWLVSETRFSRGHAISVHPAVEQPVSLTFSDESLGLSHLQVGKRCEIGSRLPMVSLARH